MWEICLIQGKKHIFHIHCGPFLESNKGAASSRDAIFHPTGFQPALEINSWSTCCWVYYPARHEQFHSTFICQSFFFGEKKTPKGCIQSKVPWGNAVLPLPLLLSQTLNPPHSVHKLFIFLNLKRATPQFCTGGKRERMKDISAGCWWEAP